MQLQSQDTFSQNAIIGVREVHRQTTVHVVLDMIPFGDDDDVIPVVQPEQFLELVGRDQWLI